MTRQVIDPKGEPVTFPLLSGHIIKLTLNNFLYPQINISLITHWLLYCGIFYHTVNPEIVLFNEKNLFLVVAQPLAHTFNSSGLKTELPLVHILISKHERNFICRRIHSCLTVMSN